ncbi:hypothetical protein HU200_006948 [Digitaria exilis]|uniref:Uncharacterized protein n=1 Tax=Digitaria exilis TaxID=1010633 RepID=A0A835FR68_9POAL|nr:hypothetical protein HU200_006948 [Digitaria exilis]
MANVLSLGMLFLGFPYLLPCLCISFFAAVVLVSCIWLPALSIPLIAAYPFMTHLSATKSKRRCKWHSCNCNVLLQGYWSCWSRRGVNSRGPKSDNMPPSFLVLSLYNLSVYYSDVSLYSITAFKCVGLVLTFKPFLAVPEHYDMK